MWSVLRHALLLRVRTPLLGDVPLNAVGLACFAVLGIVNPGLWFVGAALETGYLAVLISNRRFRKLVRALEHAATAQDARIEIDTRVGQLEDRRRKRYSDLDQKCGRVAQLYRERGVESFLVDGNLTALQKLRELYVQLLCVQQDIDSADRTGAEAQLRNQIAALEKELGGSRLSGSVRESKSATLGILRKRLAGLQRRQETLEEIASDLLRIEAQVDLALENALLEGKPQVISMSIELASDLLDIPSIESTSVALDVAPPSPTSAPTRELESE